MLSQAVLDILKNAAVLDFGIQGVGFLVAAAVKTDKLYDLLGSGAQLLIAYRSLSWGRARFRRQYIQTSMVCLWAARLGYLLFSRILREGHDRRFNRIREDPKMLFIAWTMQGVWVLSNLLPTLFQNSKTEEKPEGWAEWFGWGLWVLGFIIESVADHQKTVFRADPSNSGKFIQSGLWKLSRHPNYFGEILMWTGLYISTFNLLKGLEHLAIISPLFSAFILTKVSGIPMLEKSALRRWGDMPAYRKYLAETPALIPSLRNLFK